MDAEIFKVNLRALLEARGMSQRELAERCGIGEQWVRRVCSRGLTRVEGRNRDQLQAICQLFGISPVERLWSPDLHAAMGEAAWYGAKVEEILNETRSVTDFEGFVDITEDSIIEMVQRIDRLHMALKRSQEKLAQLHGASLDQRTTWGAKDSSPATADSKKVRLATEYAAKLSQVFRAKSLAGKDRLWQVAFVIEALYSEKAASRVVTIFRDRDQNRYEDWLVFFGSRETLENSVAVALAKFHEDQVLTWLTGHSPPDDPCDGSIANWALVGKWIAEANREAMEDMSTHGGDVAGGD